MQSIEHVVARTTPEPVGVVHRIALHAALATRSPVSVRRVTTIADARFATGSAQVLAWDVEPQGPGDLSSFLCRAADGAFFLFCRAATHAESPSAVVPLSHARAVTWFHAHPTHFAELDALR
jgi:hypothetical protein